MKRPLVSSLLVLASLAPLLGCAELDISHEAPVDFGRYRSVTVAVNGPLGDDGDYLAAELRDVSGFQTVVVGEPGACDAEEPPSTDACLSVDVRLGSYYDSDGFLVFVAEAAYELRDAEGKRLTSDGVSEQGGFADTASEEVLGEVARAFIPSYDY